MEKQRFYYSVRFSPETLGAAEAAFANLLPHSAERPRRTWHISLGNDRWTFDSAEEFFAEYRKKADAAFISHSAGAYTYRCQIIGRIDVAVTVEAPTRSEIESVFAHFDSAESTARVSEERQQRPRLFIGHGRNAAWRDLKDHLQDQHGFAIVAYETGARAGHTIRDILEEMLDESSFAILVLTGEEETVDGARRARQNVIHEVGLFQGRLGFARAIVLLEDGAEEFSNIAGIHQIRFHPGRIRETFGDVLATIRREFGARGV
jgi:predicted nucleotide-binding protein